MTGDAARNFEGMTLNERLIAAGQLQAWDAAVAARDKGEVVGILKMPAVSDPDRVAGDVLAPPEMTVPESDHEEWVGAHFRAPAGSLAASA